MDSVLVIFIVFAAVLRLGSVLVSRRNEARLRARGAEEYGAANSKWIVVLHSVFYMAAMLEAWWRGTQVDALTWLGVALYLFAMLALAYVIYELDGLWTIKVMIAPDHVLKQSWLFRNLRHPNYYLNIIPELLALVLLMKAWLTLVILYPAYLAALFCRIRIEEQAMRQRFAAY